MGIPRFVYWLRNRNFKGVLRKGVPPIASSLSIDLNGLIHKSAQYVYAYGDYEDAKRQAINKTMDPVYLKISSIYIWLINFKPYSHKFNLKMYYVLLLME